MDKATAKILVADDSAFMRKIVVETLKGDGYANFIEVENGNQAIEKFGSESPDLVLLDVIMPEKDGIETVKELGSKVKVLMVSAVGQESVVSEAMGHGAKGFIVKPFDKAKIIEEVNKVLGV
jgi:two-component system chemotaxis response regulator CheY